jgi:hypothetical protein
MLVVWYEVRCHGVHGPVRHLSEGESGTPETSQTATTSKDPRMEMGRDRNVFHSLVASYPSWV